MSSTKYLAGLSAVVIAVIAAVNNWPPMLKRCALNDPNMDKCLMKATQDALSKIAKGLPLIGLKSLDPLRNASFTVTSPSGPVSLTMTATDVTISGPSKVRLRKVTYLRKSSKYIFEGIHDKLMMTGKFHVKGSLVLFPLNNQGTFKYELRGIHGNHSVKLTKNTRDGRHGHITFKMFSAKLMKINLSDKSLSPTANDALNNVVNSNWNLLIEYLTPPMEKAIHDMYSAALLPLTSKFSVLDFFPASKGRNNEDEEDEDEEKFEGSLFWPF